MRNKGKMFRDLKACMTDYEFEPIKDKVRRYLMNYTGGGVGFETFSFTIDQGRVESINFYTDKINEKYRKVAFDKYGNVTSVRHFIGDRWDIELCRRAIDDINGEVDACYNRNVYIWH